MARSPEFVQQYLKEVEKCASEIISDQQQIVELDKQRNGNREALRCLQRDSQTSKRGIWMCLSNTFLNLDKDHAITTIQKGTQNSCDKTIL